MQRRLALALALAGGAALAIAALAVGPPAFAHPGHHGHLALGQLLQHLATPWHALPVVAALAAAAAIVWRLRRQPTRRHSEAKTLRKDAS